MQADTPESIYTDTDTYGNYSMYTVLRHATLLRQDNGYNKKNVFDKK